MTNDNIFGSKLHVHQAPLGLNRPFMSRDLMLLFPLNWWRYNLQARDTSDISDILEEILDKMLQKS